MDQTERDLEDLERLVETYQTVITVGRLALHVSPVTVIRRGWPFSYKIHRLSEVAKFIPREDVLILLKDCADRKAGF